MNEGLLPAISPCVKKEHYICKEWYVANDSNNIWHTGDHRMMHKNIQSIDNYWILP